MNYDEALEYELTAQEAKNYIRKHDLRFSDFVDEIGSKTIYTGSEVLNWLGY